MSLAKVSVKLWLPLAPWPYEAAVVRVSSLPPLVSKDRVMVAPQVAKRLGKLLSSNQHEVRRARQAARHEKKENEQADFPSAVRRL